MSEEQPKVVTASLEEVKRRLAEKIIAEGGEFRTCANCGTHYPLGVPDDDGRPWNDETVCGERCHRAYVAYLNDPGQW